MRKNILIIIAMLMVHAYSTCQTSTTQEVYASSFDVQLGTDAATYVKDVIDFIEDSSGILYEIGIINNGSKFFIRKLDSSRNEVWTGVYDGYYPIVGSSKLISGETVLALCFPSSDTYLYYIELNVSDGSSNIVRHTSLKLGISIDTYYAYSTFRFSPSGNYVYALVFDYVDDYKIKIVRIDSNSPTADYALSQIAPIFSSYYLHWAVALSDTNVVTTGIVSASVSMDSVAVTSIEWAATPTTNWNIKIQNNVATYAQLTRIVENSDMSNVLLVFPTVSKDIAVHVIDASTGDVIKKGKASGGYVNSPLVYASRLIADTHLYISTKDGTSGDTTLLYFDITNMSGSAYTNTATTKIFFGISPLLSDNLVRISISDSTLLNYKILQFNPHSPSQIAMFETLDTDFTFSEITNTDYDSIQHTVTPLASTSLANTGGIIPFFADTSTESNKESIVFNVWDTATAVSVTGGVSGGAFTPEYACVASTSSGMTTPTVAYTLVAGSGSVPSWTSIDGSSAEISYDSPTTASAESFSIRATVNGDSSSYYDTAISLTVTATNTTTVVPSPPNDNENGGSDSDKKRAGIIAAIVIGGLIGLSLIVVLIIVIVKKVCKASASSTTVTAFTHDTVGVSMTTNQIVPRKP